MSQLSDEPETGRKTSLVKQTSSSGIRNDTPDGASRISFSTGETVELATGVRASASSNGTSPTNELNIARESRDDFKDEIPEHKPPTTTKASRLGSLSSRILPGKLRASFSSSSSSTTPTTATTTTTTNARRTSSDTMLNNKVKEEEQLYDFPPVVSPGGGRSRIFTVEQVRRNSFLSLNPIKSESQLRGARRNSVRLSEADVGFLLGRVNRIGPESLHTAAKEGNSQLCEALVRGGVDVNSALGNKTALLVAVEHGKTDCTLHLAELGADLEYKDGNGHTALWHAVSLGKMTCIQTLATLGADANSTLIFVHCLQQLETALIQEQEAQYLEKSETCRILLQHHTTPLEFHRDSFKPSTLFLVDEWKRAAKAGEELVAPPLTKVVEGETHLLRFLKQHRRKVSILTVIKIWFVVMFIGFDLATRDMAMTPQRFMVYVFLYVGAYYT